MNVTDEMVQAALDAQPFTESNSSLRVWQLIDCDGERTDKLMRAALEAALSHAAGQEVEHSAKDFGIELSQRATFVPCDCGCGRSCCAHCGVDVGFLPAVARSEGEG